MFFIVENIFPLLKIVATLRHIMYLVLHRQSLNGSGVHLKITTAPPSLYNSSCFSGLALQ